MNSFEGLGGGERVNCPQMSMKCYRDGTGSHDVAVDREGRQEIDWNGCRR